MSGGNHRREQGRTIAQQVPGREPDHEYRGERRSRRAQAGYGDVNPENLERDSDDPIKEDRLDQPRFAVEVRGDPVVLLNHLPRRGDVVEFVGVYEGEPLDVGVRKDGEEQRANGGPFFPGTAWGES